MARKKQLTAKLGGSRVLTLSGVQKLSVKCTGGAVWVTSGDGYELALASGRRGRRDRAGSAATVAIQGIPEGEVKLTWR